MRVLIGEGRRILSGSKKVDVTVWLAVDQREHSSISFGKGVGRETEGAGNRTKTGWGKRGRKSLEEAEGHKEAITKKD